MPVSVIRDGRNPVDGWTPTDRMLALALHQYEDDTCPGCGGDKDHAWSGTSPEYVTKTLVCAGCAALEAKQPEGATPPPGQKRWVTPAFNAADDAEADSREVGPTFDPPT